MPCHESGLSLDLVVSDRIALHFGPVGDHSYQNERDGDIQQALKTADKHASSPSPSRVCVKYQGLAHYLLEKSSMLRKNVHDGLMEHVLV